jgi:hypothetical protein
MLPTCPSRAKETHSRPFAARPGIFPSIGQSHACALARLACRALAQVTEQIGELGSGQGRAAAAAIEVLERIGTAEVRQLLAVLAEGAPAARLTREAKLALDRLAVKAAVSP